MIGRWAWSAVEARDNAYVTDFSTLGAEDERKSLFYRQAPGDTVMFGASVSGPITRAVSVGCAFAILKRLT